MQTQSPVISHLGPRSVGQLSVPEGGIPEVSANLHMLGIGMDEHHVSLMYDAYKKGNLGIGSVAMDAALTPSLTTPSIATPVQFLQAWLSGFVFIITKVRKIDDLVGITTQGRWEDEQIVQGILEHTGTPAVYGDLTNIPLSSWNNNFETRTIVRFEEGMSVGRLEEARAAAVRISSSEAKRYAAAEALEIVRNDVGFNGYQDGVNRTFGFLNDPELPAYVTVPVGASTFTQWATKTFLEITGDIRSWYAALRTQSGGRIDPGQDQVTMAIALSVYDQLSVTSSFGNSVMQWLKETYPNTRIVSVPQLDLANGGENVAYLYAEGMMDDASTDDQRTFVQVVPSRFQTLGVEQQAKRYVEDYSNATAGTFLKRPFAVYRASGI